MKFPLRSLTAAPAALCIVLPGQGPAAQAQAHQIIKNQSNKAWTFKVEGGKPNNHYVFKEDGKKVAEFKGDGTFTIRPKATFTIEFDVTDGSGGDFSGEFTLVDYKQKKVGFQVKKSDDDISLTFKDTREGDKYSPQVISVDDGPLNILALSLSEDDD